MIRSLRARAWVWMLAASVSLAAGMATAAEGLSLADVVRSGDRAQALSLIADGVDVNVPEASGNGTTALHWAAYQGDTELVRALLEAGAEPTVFNLFSSSPLMEAGIIGHTEIIRLLLEAGVDVESANYEGQTALMAVARTGNVEAARLLLEAGANPNAVEGWGGQTAIMWAAARRHPEMIRLLAQYGADPNARAYDRVWERRTTGGAETRPHNFEYGGMNAALFAAREGCAACIPALVEVGADLDIGNRNGTTPLVVALLNRRYDTAMALIEAGADPSQWDVFGRTPTYVVIDLDAVMTSGRPDAYPDERHSALDVLEALLVAGANPDVPLRQNQPFRNVTFDRGYSDGSGPNVTPLQRALWGALNPEAARILLEHGANPQLLNGQSLLAYAVSPRSCGGAGTTCSRDRTSNVGLAEDALAAVQTLVELGFDVNDRNTSNGQTALHVLATRASVTSGGNAFAISEAENFLPVIEWFLRHGASPTIEANNGDTPLSLANDSVRSFIESVVAEVNAAQAAVE